MSVFKENKRVFNENLLYLAAKYDYFDLYCFLENTNLNPCHIITCFNALNGKSLKILKCVYERYKYSYTDIWIKTIVGLTIVNKNYVIDKNSDYENADWSVMFYACISNQNDEKNKELTDFLICIGCPLNENLSFYQ